MKKLEFILGDFESGDVLDIVDLGECIQEIIDEHVADIASDPAGPLDEPRPDQDDLVEGIFAEVRTVFGGLVRAALVADLEERRKSDELEENTLAVAAENAAPIHVADAIPDAGAEPIPPRST